MTKKKNDYQLELFAPSFPASIAVKDQQDLMQYPFFSLSKRKRVTPIEYDDGNVKIRVTGSDYGIANIYDEEVLIYVASLLMEAHNKGLSTSPEIQASKYDILEFLGKATGGNHYQRLKASLQRLQATSIHTTIRNEKGYKIDAGFSWIDSWKAVEKNGKAVAIKFKLADWLYDGIINEKLVLTLDREYFQLEGGLERFLYRLCRKVVGKTAQGFLEMNLETVHKRSGTTQKLSRFRKMLAEIMEKQTIPSYWVLVFDKNNQAPTVLGIARRSGESASEGFSRLLKQWKDRQRHRVLKNSKGRMRGLKSLRNIKDRGV